MLNSTESIYRRTDLKDINPNIIESRAYNIFPGLAKRGNSFAESRVCDINPPAANVFAYVKNSTHTPYGQTKPPCNGTWWLRINGIEAEEASIRGTSRGRRRPIVTIGSHDPHRADVWLNIACARKEPWRGSDVKKKYEPAMLKNI